MQGLLQLLEKEVVLRCREKDLRLVEQLLPECLDGLQKEWGSTTKVVIDKHNFLPSESAGGVELSSRAGKIKVSSTLESRLELIASQVSFSGISVFLFFHILKSKRKIDPEFSRLFHK